MKVYVECKDIGEYLIAQHVGVGHNMLVRNGRIQYSSDTLAQLHELICSMQTNTYGTDITQRSSIVGRWSGCGVSITTKPPHESFVDISGIIAQEVNSIAARYINMSGHKDAPLYGFSVYSSGDFISGTSPEMVEYYGEHALNNALRSISDRCRRNAQKVGAYKSGMLLESYGEYLHTMCFITIDGFLVGETMRIRFGDWLKSAHTSQSTRMSKYFDSTITGSPGSLCNARVEYIPKSNPAYPVFHRKIFDKHVPGGLVYPKSILQRREEFRVSGITGPINFTELRITNQTGEF